MTSPRAIEIIGGGLAGLALGLALRRYGVPVTLHDAGEYPRHRVCGEFIRGLSPHAMQELELTPLLADARPHREVAWFTGPQLLRRQRLPAPALALSRHTLDHRLAAAFVAAGGELLQHSRVPPCPAEGRVLATGRRPASRSPWLGLKVHARGLKLDRSLEMHLGQLAYVGLCELPDGAVNVCGLFRRRSLSARSTPLLLDYLQASGLGALAHRLRTATLDAASFCGVAGLAFGRNAAAPPPSLGDAFAMIPPFTGHGMAMAFESAAVAIAPLLAWSRGQLAWPGTARAIHHRLARRFRVRLGIASACHPFLLQPRRQRWLAAASHAGALPIDTLQRLLS